MKNKKLLGKIALYILVIALCVIIAFPIYWMMVTAVSNESDTFSVNPSLLPKTVITKGFKDLFKAGNIFLWIRNSAFVALFTSMSVVLIATFAAYSLSRFKYKGKGMTLLLLLVTQMLPEALLLLPIYVLYKQMHLLNSLFGLVLINTAFQLPVGTWIMKNFFDTIPKELDEAACIDGCNSYSILFRILMPAVTPAMAATGIIALFDAWNEYMFAVSMATKSSKWVSSVGLSSFIGMYAVPVTQIMAGALLFTLPCLLIFIFFQRFIVSGLTQGSVKG